MPEKEEFESAAKLLIPAKATLKSLRESAADCKACDLWEKGTQTVFGEGGRRSQVVLIGEQPGKEEDLAGHPFVGPAGKLLDQALGEAGIDRTLTYVTNVVKHFKWEPRGKRRIHKKSNAAEINACRPWLVAELALVKPKVVVCLGATAAQSLLGKQFKVTLQRGTLLEAGLECPILATVHPSSILRAPDSDTRHSEMARFIDDLRIAAHFMAEHGN